MYTVTLTLSDSGEDRLDVKLLISPQPDMTKPPTPAIQALAACLEVLKENGVQIGKPEVTLV
jgi:hypothetical protein